MLLQQPIHPAIRWLNSSLLNLLGSGLNMAVESLSQNRCVTPIRFLSLT